MRKLLATFAIAPMLAPAPAGADYRACMEFCLKEHEFTHCNNICREQEGNTSAASTKEGKSQPPVPEILKDRDCSTSDLKAEALGDYLTETYDTSNYVIFSLERDKYSFRLGFLTSNLKRYCRPVVRITDDCRVSGFEKLNCVVAKD